MIRGVGEQQNSVFLELVLFTAGPYRFGVEASRVRGSGELPDYAVPCVESLLSLSGGIGNNRRQCLTIKGNSRNYELSVAVPLELYTLPTESIHPLPAAVTARCKLPGLRGLATTEEGLVLLVDLCLLLDTD